MSKPTIIIHGGAGPGSEFIHINERLYHAGLRDAAETGNDILKNGGSSVDAVEAAVRSLEDNPLFNAGRGSALNNKGEVEMDASMMRGNDKKAGALALAKNIRNPI